MLDYILENYSALINYSLLGSFTLFFIWELVAPWANNTSSLPLRWWNTILLYMLVRVFGYLVIPVTSVVAANYAQDNSVGLLNLMDDYLPLSIALSIVLSILLYDLCHYWLHRVLHRVPLLWRLHRLHHSDPDVDIITELKHHPFELAVSSLLASVAVLALGLNPLGIIIRALFLPAISLLSHANIQLPQRLDQALRLVIITPAMHRIHHSSYQPETDSNYGTVFSFWDRMFGSYVAYPQGGYDGMQLGLREFRAPRELWIDRLLLQPFKNPQRISARPGVIDNEMS